VYKLQRLISGTRIPDDWRTLDTTEDETRARLMYDQLKRQNPTWNLRVVDQDGAVICGVGA
jgi:hypothetical protein